MQTLGSGIAHFLAAQDADAAKMLHIMQNNQKVKQAIKKVWLNDEDTGNYILAHINRLYITNDAAFRKGMTEGQSYPILVFHLDDSKAKAELNARREWLLATLEQLGMPTLKELHIRHATLSMKHRYTFPETVALNQQSLGGGTNTQTPKTPTKNLDYNGIDQAFLLETIKRACCLSLDNSAEVWNFLRKIEGSAVVESAPNPHGARLQRSYYWEIFTSKSAQASQAAFLAQHGQTIRSRAQVLGLVIQKIRIHESPLALRGQHCFTLQGYPQALKDLDLQKIRSEALKNAAKNKQQNNQRDIF